MTTLMTEHICTDCGDTYMSPDGNLEGPCSVCATQFRIHAASVVKKAMESEAKVSPLEKIAWNIFEKAFTKEREPRSEAYKGGVLALLRWKIAGVPMRHPYEPGTVESDAHLAGLDEGWTHFREYRNGIGKE